METQPVSEPVQAQHASTPSESQVSHQSAYQYAGFWRRLGASFIDSLIVGSVSFVVNLTISIIGHFLQNTFAVGIMTSLVSLVVLLGSVAYYVYFIGNSGQTVGKKLLGIKVIHKDTGAPVGYLMAFVRETIGKFVSSFIFCLGYLWMLWDANKQAWHDKIAHTIVVRA